METLTIGSRFVGPPGIGHGGYAAAMLAGFADGPVMVRLRRPVPLDRELRVEHRETGPGLSDGDVLIATCEPHRGELDVGGPVSLEAAEDARRRCAGTRGLHLAPTCFSCGVGESSFRVHAGPVTGTGVFATPWTPPAWTASGGVVGEAFLWAAMDCAAGWKIITDAEGKRAVTGEITARILGEVRPESTYALVAWAGPWEGRKRTAGSATYDDRGAPVAVSESLWISI